MTLESQRRPAQRLFDLTGKVALITGGAGGIGLAMAEDLAQAGSDLVIWDIRAEALEAAHARLSVFGGRVRVETVDVTNEAAVREGVAQAVASCGRLDTVIACAGVFGRPEPFVDLGLEAWRRHMSVNLDGAFLTLREGARHMCERAKAGDRGGSLIAISSIAALQGLPRQQAYVASKGALAAMMRSMAVEFGRFGIRANAIAPGSITTEMTRAMQAAPAVAEALLPRIPLGRWGQPSDFGGVAVYLASDASAYHTGDLLVIDGGFVVA